MWKWSPAILSLMVVSCITGPVQLPANASRIDPPDVFRTWWAMTERCSGVQRPMDSVTWYIVPGNSVMLRGSESDGAFIEEAAGSQIVLASGYADDGQLVRHEMLHALLRVHGHPRDQFLGRCAGEVACAPGCIADAGPMGRQQAMVVEPSAAALTVTARTEPEEPSLQVDSGHFRFIVTARNTSDSAIEVVELTRGGLPPNRVTFSYDMIDSLGEQQLGEAPPTDESRTIFQKGETKTQVFDFRIGDSAVESRPPLGQYTLLGRYSSAHASDSVHVLLRP